MTKQDNRLVRVLADGAGGSVDAVVSLPAARRGGAAPLFVLAHGAGAGMNHPFLVACCEALTRRGLAVARFQFPYMQRGRRAPDRAVVLENCYRTVADQLRDDAAIDPGLLILGGKSMGGRIATQIAASGYPCDGLILLGYPLHPAGRPDKPRIDHFPALHQAQLFIQGTRDSLCNLEDLRASLRATAGPSSVHVIEGGDHSFALPKRMGRSGESVISEISEVVSAWLETVPSRLSRGKRRRI